MDDSKNLTPTYSGQIIVRNTVYNLLGYGIPLIVALIFIPPMISSLGEEKFGILNIAWIIIGYFSFFDFGIGKGLTKITAEKVGSDNTEQIPVIFWSSLLIMLIISSLIALVLIFFVPSITDLFNISDSIKQETTSTFYILILAIPIVSTTAGLRGVLEAYLQFGIVNIIRILLGVFTFVGPILCLIFTTNLLWIVVVLILLRIIIWVLYLFLCLKINPEIKREIRINFNSIRPVIKFSVWISVVNIVGPIILYSDRFLIGALISATAITYYAVSYETISKILLISGALVGVLFPMFSSSYVRNPAESKVLLFRGIKFIFLIIYPLIFLIVTFAYDGMLIWLGGKFAENSSMILQFLAIGILFNSISSIPNNFFQGIGKPRIPAIINLIELPLYLSAMWFTISNWGAVGASVTYMFAAMVDALIMYTVARNVFQESFLTTKITLYILILILILTIPFMVNYLIFKIVFATIILFIYILFFWRYILSQDEKQFFKVNMKFLIKRSEMSSKI